MSDRFRLAVVGVGRIGLFHALHVQELAAYKGELACYLERCLSGEPFPVDHVDGLRALEVAAAGSRSLRTQEHGGWVEYAVCD